MFKLKTPLQEKLRTYSATSVDTLTQKSAVAKSSKSRSTLLALAPFAAGALIMPTSLQAQCGQGTAAFNATGGVYGDGQVDVDGDGNADFDFDIAGGLYITPVGTMSVGLFSSSYVTFVGPGDAITPATPPGGFKNTGYAQMSNGAYFTNGTAASYFVPIRDGAGNLGFIRVVKDGLGGFTIDVTQTGVAVANTTEVFAGACDPNLPVELISFEATPNEKAIALQWVTANEEDNKGFEVQRSIDGVNFNKIGWVDGEGRSTREVTYAFADEDAKSNTMYYYRLRQMDFDDTEDFSGVLMAEIENQDLSFKVFPNPAVASSSVQISINANIAHQGSVQLFDITGKVVQTLEVEVMKGENTVDLATNSLARGTYVVKMMLGDETKYQKLMVQ